MNFQDALFNWLQIKTVAEARPDDQAAQNTVHFFDEILREDHKLTHFFVSHTDLTMIHVTYEKDGVKKKQMYDREAVEQLLQDIMSEPKYNE